MSKFEQQIEHVNGNITKYDDYINNIWLYELASGGLLEQLKPKKRCAYLPYCYIAEGSECFGFKRDCPLYMSTNDRHVTEESFHKAMDALINKTKIKHEKQIK